MRAVVITKHGPPEVLKVEDMYATFVVIALLGALLSYGLAALRSRLLPWVPDVGDR